MLDFGKDYKIPTDCTQNKNCHECVVNGCSWISWQSKCSGTSTGLANIETILKVGYSKCGDTLGICELYKNFVVDKKDTSKIFYQYDPI